jgi:hypothetical protein
MEISDSSVLAATLKSSLFSTPYSFSFTYNVTLPDLKQACKKFHGYDYRQKFQRTKVQNQIQNRNIPLYKNKEEPYNTHQVKGCNSNQSCQEKGFYREKPGIR